jgi:hypothetical protein
MQINNFIGANASPGKAALPTGRLHAFFSRKSATPGTTAKIVASSDCW